LYGKNGIAFDMSTILDAPTGKAARDYSEWVKANPEIARELDETIKLNAKTIYGDDLVWLDLNGHVQPFYKHDVEYWVP
jgi:hypothetical protein